MRERKAANLPACDCDAGRLPRPGERHFIMTIARMVHEGGISSVEMARALGIGPKQLKARLLMMERLGFLAIVDSCGCSDLEGHCQCCGLSCTGIKIRVYRLTGKGLGLAKSLSQPPPFSGHPRR